MIQRQRSLRLVPRTGIEPALPCENQILSLARLPIPPSGLFSTGVQYYERKAIAASTGPNIFFESSSASPGLALRHRAAPAQNRL